jgi:hypothetical protein
LDLFFCLLLQSSNLGSRLVLAGVAVWEELYPVRGADGLSEEALLIQQFLDGIVLSHFVLFYDLRKGSLVRSQTDSRSDREGTETGIGSKENKSQKKTAYRTLHFPQYFICCYSLLL